jgi:hypothetical protein
VHSVPLFSVYQIVQKLSNKKETETSIRAPGIFHHKATKGTKKIIRGDTQRVPEIWVVLTFNSNHPLPQVVPTGSGASQKIFNAEYAGIAGVRK